MLHLTMQNNMILQDNVALKRKLSVFNTPPPRSMSSMSSSHSITAELEPNNLALYSISSGNKSRPSLTKLIALPVPTAIASNFSSPEIQLIGVENPSPPKFSAGSIVVFGSEAHKKREQETLHPPSLFLHA